MILLNRRSFATGIAAMSSVPAWAQKPSSPIAHGELAQNPIALKFESVSREFPDVDIWGPAGTKNIHEYKGRTILMPLWAEWCAPCMLEMPDFARLQKKYGNDKFAIIPILTDTRKKFTPELLANVFKDAHTDIFEPLIENKLGNRLMLQMAARGDEAALPCNLLLAPSGKVIARDIGTLRSTDDAAPAKTYLEVLSRVSDGAIQSRWGQDDGEQFAQAMANGFLT